MNIKKAVFFGVLALLSTLIYFYIGYRHTIYGVGVYLVPVGLLLSGILTTVLLVFKRTWRPIGWSIFFVLNSLVFLSLIAEHLVRTYKPTATVQIPEEFEGTVHVFIGEGDSKEILIDKNGIGYFQYHGQVDWKVKQGSNNITNVLNEGGFKKLQLTLEDTNSVELIDVNCFDVVKGRAYPNTSFNQKHTLCMDEMNYRILVANGIIDQGKITKQIRPKH